MITPPNIAWLEVGSGKMALSRPTHQQVTAETEKIFHGKTSNKLPKDIQPTARRKSIYLDDAEDLQGLLTPPGNRLEKLKGERAGQYSIRINDQWRICFKWSGNKAKDVEIVDYHG